MAHFINSMVPCSNISSILDQKPLAFIREENSNTCECLIESINELKKISHRVIITEYHSFIFPYTLSCYDRNTSTTCSTYHVRNGGGIQVYPVYGYVVLLSYYARVYYTGSVGATTPA